MKKDSDEIKKSSPKIRFKGFADPWEQRKLGDVTEEFRSGSFIPASRINTKGEYPVYGGNGLRGYTNTYNHDGEFALIGRQGALCGNMNYSVGKAYFTEHAVTVKANSLSDTKFLYYLLSVMRLGQYSDQSAQPGLAVGKLINLQNMFPRSNEQHRIGEFFYNLDNLITLHQRKCEGLKLVKKSLLEKLFPKDGERFPELRFKGFTDPWEQRKLGEIADKVTEKNGNLEVQETFTNSAEFGVVSQRDFFEHDISNSEHNDGYYVVRPDDFVYNPRVSVTAPVGPINRNKLHRSGVMSPLYTVFRTRNVNPKFLEWFFKSSSWHNFMFFNGDTGARADRFSIKDSVFFEMPIPLPDLEEQGRIGNLFESLDNLITLHQRKLEKLNNIKKSMLEYMFP